MVKVVMNDPMRHVVDFPGQRRRPRHVYFAGDEKEIGLSAPVGRIKKTDPVGDKRIAVIIGFQWIGGDTPNSVFVFLHWHGFRHALAREQDFLRVRIAKPERDRIVRVNFRGNQWRGRLVRMRQPRTLNRRRPLRETWYSDGGKEKHEEK